MKTLIVITGPTGVGKTELCLCLADFFNTPIINADSRQIFAEIPIGTAAPTKEQQKRIKHYFVGNHHLADYYSAALYEQDVIKLLGQLFAKNDVAILSGGSMMYIDAVCKGIDDIPTIDEETRATMRRRLTEEGLHALVNELKILDHEYWQIVDRSNPRRVVHALEICHMTGKPYTYFRKNEIKKRPFKIVKIGLNRPREELYDGINARVHGMINKGLIDEAGKVYHLKGLNSLNTVGYKEMFEYFDGNISLDEAISKIQCNTRRYARKQITWFKKDESMKWFPPNNVEEILKYIEDAIQITTN